MQHRNVFGSPDALAADFLHLMNLAAAQAIAERGAFHVALTGGSAAQALYPVLAQTPMPWAQIHLWFGDERAVPPEHADSNYGLAQQALLSRIAIPVANVHRMEGELAPSDAAARYEIALQDLAGGALDVVHLGMGPDGHVASLFPGHQLLSSPRLVDALTDSPKPPPARVTLTLRCLAAARSLWFLVLGRAKADAVREALLEPSSPLPAALASRAAREARWLLDDEAATLLKA